MPRVWPWLAALAACSVGDLDLSGKACPCAAGYVCDPSRGVCILGTVAPGGDAGRDAAGDAGLPSAEGGLDGGADAGEGGTEGGADTGMPSCGGLAACGSSCVDTRNDPHNCGRCGHDCLGGGCSASQCQPVVLVSGQIFEAGPILAGASLYWGTQTDIETCPTSGCPMGVTTVVSPLYAPTMGSTGFPYTMVADATSIYWAQDGPPATIVSAPLGGGMPTLLQSGGFPGVAGIAVSTGKLYWSDVSLMIPAVYSCALTGMGCTTPLLVVGGRSYPTFLDVQGSFLYFLDGLATASLVACALPTCPSPTTLAASLASPGSLALDASSAYWTEPGAGMSGQGSVRACALAGCPMGPRTIASGLTQPSGAVVDATDVYFTELPTAGAEIERCPLAGCAAAPELVLNARAISLLGDATSLYWADGNGNILRLAK